MVIQKHLLEYLKLSMPTQFDVIKCDEAYSRIISNSNGGKYPEALKIFNGAWIALAYRVKACDDHKTVLLDSIISSGTSPSFPERYIQERELFNFFISGMSSIECLCFGLHALGSLIDAEKFSLDLSVLKNTYPHTTRRNYIDRFENATLTTALDNIMQDEMYHQWKEIRIYLFHRTAPGRIHNASVGDPSKVDKPSEWGGYEAAVAWKEGISLEASAFEERFDWLMNAINNLLDGTVIFSLSELNK